MRSSDNIKITKAQLRAARALLNWSAEKLAEEAGVGVATVRRAESEPKPDSDKGEDRKPAKSKERSMIQSTESAIRRALEDAGVIFVAENGEGPGVRIRKLP